MTNLIVCAYPGDELTIFGNIILCERFVDWHSILINPDPPKGSSVSDIVKNWENSCKKLNITPVKVMNISSIQVNEKGYPDPDNFPDFDFSKYEKIYVPDIQDLLPLRSFVTAAIAKRIVSVWMESSAGPGSRFCGLSNENYNLLITNLNSFYGPQLRDRKISAKDLHGTRQYGCFRGADITRFYSQIICTDSKSVEDNNPWDISTSHYEQDRYSLELEVLGGLEWNSMIECGACTGNFTKKLFKLFPERKITAVEPNSFFAKILKKELAAGINVFQGRIEDIKISCDLLFASCVLYYCIPIPEPIFESPLKYLVTSHDKKYHDEVLCPAIKARGWKLKLEKELLPRIENFCSIPVIKDEAIIAVWEKKT
ncbi:MAG: hypothetical protein A3J83_03830 [Elusimicrobia bacterium RIFOXYA2_FULL_40_6]|nr:MAG: hypothetical protein A3J83_03830 [Elusimicrobia bacterium RIFOXYA2_FULL_40_6]